MSTPLTPFERESSILSPELAKTQTPASTSMLKTSPSTIEQTPEQAWQLLLVRRAIQGDEKVFSEIIEQYGTVLLRTATMIMMNRATAEDVVREALIQAWHHLPDLHQAEALHFWLLRLVVNQCLSFKYRLARTTTFMRQAISALKIDVTIQIAEYHKRRLEQKWNPARIFENLPVKQRVVIILHYYNGLTLHEMGQILQISEDTLKKRNQAALRSLRCVLRLVDIDEYNVPLLKSLVQEHQDHIYLSTANHQDMFSETEAEQRWLDDGGSRTCEDKTYD